MLSSPIFAQSDRHVAFLRYVVEAAIEGRSDSVKEYTIATEVLGRNDSYDPRFDSGVRVEAMRLRSKIREYYDIHGSGDEIGIDVPKGGYTPVFYARPSVNKSLPHFLGTPWGIWATVVVAIISLAGYFVANRILPRRSQAIPGVIRVAVLPFKNIGNLKENEAYSDGLAESLTTELTKVRRFHVKPYGAVRSAGLAVSDVTPRLGVDYILTGSLQKDRDSFRITARLVRVSDDTQVWANSYDSPWTDILKVESQVSATVVRQLQVALSPVERADLQRPPTTNVAAYEALLKGRHNSLQYFYSGNLAFYVSAEQSLLQAAALDPAFADAPLELGLLYGRRYQLSGERDWRDKASGFFRNVLSMNPCQPVANALLANIALDNGNMEEGIALGRKAVSCDPNSSQAHNTLGLVYLFMGFFEAAEVECERGIEADPLFLSPYLNRAAALLYQRRNQDAIQASEEAVRVEPQSALALSTLGNILLASGRIDEGLQSWDKAVGVSPQLATVREVVGGLAGWERGQREDARRIARKYAASPVAHSWLWKKEYLELCIRAESTEVAVACVADSPRHRSYRSMISDSALARFKGNPAFTKLLEGRRKQWELDVTKYRATLPATLPELEP
jgi:adenylate cyclase